MVETIVAEVNLVGAFGIRVCKDLRVRDDVVLFEILN